MNKLSAKLVGLHKQDGYSGPRVAHWCPACEELHPFAVEEKQRNGAQWSFDGNLDSPTFNPSMNITVGPYPADFDGEAGKIDRCHYFLHAGRLQYLTDCTHGMAGQTIDLPDLPASVIMRIRASGGDQ